MGLLTYLRRHREDDDRPYLIGGMGGLVRVLIFGLFGLALADHYLLRHASLAAVISSALVDLANGDRISNNIVGLVANPVLVAAAQAKADDMAAKGYFAHVAPDGKDSWYWFRQQGYTFSYAGENLAVDFSDSQDVERAWMNSPTHRANILDGHFTEVGIATAVGTYEGRTTTFAVQMFGTPALPESTAPVRTLASPVVASEPALATTATSSPVLATRATSSNVGTNGPVLGASAVGLSASPPTSWWAPLISAPRTMLAYAYDALAALVLILLVLVTRLEFKRHHLRHMAAAGGLLLLMLGLFTFASVTFFSTPVIAAPSPLAAP